MIQDRYHEFLKRIAKEAGMNEAEVEQRVKEKQSTLGGLVSPEGAALIVSNELGLKFDAQKSKVAEMVIGMRNVEVLGKIMRVYPVRSYQTKKGEAGKIGSFMFADDTGSVRVVLWDVNHVALLETERVKEGDVLLLKKGDVRGTDIKELHISGKSSIEKSEETIDNVKMTFSLSQSKVRELKDGDRTSVRATIVQTFPLRFFPSCKDCRKRLAESSGVFSCVTHGEMEPRFLPVFSFYIDDGSSNIRAVCFMDSLTKLFNLTEEEIINLKDNSDEVTVRDALLGKEMVFEGRSRKNSLYNRLEFGVSSVSELNIEEIIDELKKKAGVD